MNNIIVDDEILEESIVVNGTVNNTIKEYFEILIKAHRINPYTALGKRAIASICLNLNIDKKELYEKLINDFYSDANGWYIKPYFTAENKPISAEVKKPPKINQPNRFDTVNYGYKKTNTEEEDRLNRKDEKSKFEEVLYSDNTSNALLIQATAGSGKSTYLFKLIKDFFGKARFYTEWKETNFHYAPDKKSNDSHEIDGKLMHMHFNIEAIKSAIDINGYRYTAENSVFARFELMLLERIYDLIYYFTDDDARITKIIKTFDKIAQTETVNHKICDYFKKVISKIKKTDNKTKIAEKMTKEVLKFSTYSNTRYSIGDDANRISSVQVLLNIIAMLILFEALSSNNAKNHYILFTFDGIEHLITENAHIYSEDIKNIWDSVHGFYDGFCGAFGEKVFVKSIVAARNTTVNMIPETIDEISSTIVASVVKKIYITDWYDFASISDRRKEKIDEIISGDSRFLEIIEQVTKLGEVVLHDTDSQNPDNNLIDMLKMMYNHDIRKLSENLYKSLSVFVEKAEKRLLEKFPKFMEKELTEDELKQEEYKESPLRPMKYICRRAILRSFFNAIKMSYKINYDNSEKIDNILEHIFFADLGDRKDFSNGNITMARRILLYLSHNYDDDRLSQTKLPQLMKGVLGVVVPEDQIDTFARILYNLGNIRMYRIESTWNILVSIKYTDKKRIQNKVVGFDEFKTEVIRVSEAINKNQKYESCIKLRLTCSGKFLAIMQCDYELFATRAMPTSPPIIFTKEHGTIKNTIKNVFEKAVECIRTSIEFEHDHFGDFSEMYKKGVRYLFVEKNGEKRTHSIRILFNHLTYLEHYKIFVKLNSQDKTDDYVFSLKEKERIIKLVDEYICEYQKLFNALYWGDGTGTHLDGCECLKSLGQSTQEYSYLSTYFNTLPSERVEKFMKICGIGIIPPKVNKI